jgi:UDP-N-acetylglucosamine 2-epimerase (non-hydrolysing)
MRPAIERAAVPDGIPREYAIVTLHRPSNVDDSGAVRRNVELLRELGKSVPLLLPLHHRFKAALEREGLLPKLSKALHVLPPLGYLPFLRLLSSAQFILTDSGGVQEEATYLRKRCFTLRKNTERPITIESGSNMLIDLENDSDRRTLLEAVSSPPPVVTVPELWDGRAGERIIQALRKG